MKTSKVSTVNSLRLCICALLVGVFISSYGQDSIFFAGRYHYVYTAYEYKLKDTMTYKNYDRIIYIDSSTNNVKCNEGYSITYGRGNGLICGYFDTIYYTKYFIVNKKNKRKEINKKYILSLYGLYAH
jgi:hypothetical protein